MIGLSGGVDSSYLAIKMRNMDLEYLLFMLMLVGTVKLRFQILS